MAHLALGILLGLVGEHGDFLGLAVLNHLAGDSGTLHIGSADLGALFAKHGHHGELHGVVFRRVQLLHIDDVAVLHFVLLTAGLDDCKHVVSCLFSNLATARRGWAVPGPLANGHSSPTARNKRLI